MFVRTPSGGWALNFDGLSYRPKCSKSPWQITFHITEAWTKGTCKLLFTLAWKVNISTFKMWPHLLVKVGQNQAKCNISSKDAAATGKHLDLEETLFWSTIKKAETRFVLECQCIIVAGQTDFKTSASIKKHFSLTDFKTKVSKMASYQKSLELHSALLVLQVLLTTEPLNKVQSRSGSWPLRFIQAPPTLPVQQSKQNILFCWNRFFNVSFVFGDDSVHFCPSQRPFQCEFSPRATDGTRLRTKSTERHNWSKSFNEASVASSATDDGSSVWLPALCDVFLFYRFIYFLRHKSDDRNISCNYDGAMQHWRFLRLRHAGCFWS